MKVLTTLVLSSAFVSYLVSAQQMSTPADNQCRAQAKEIALKTYQTCVSDARSAKIDQIRKEYQEQLQALKNQYEAQILELKTAAAAPKKEAAKEIVPPTTLATPSEAQSSPFNTTDLSNDLPTTTLDETPTIVEPAQPAQKNEKVEQQELTLSQPTIVLKPAPQASAHKPSQAPNNKSATKTVKQASLKNTPKAKRVKRAAPVVAQKRAKGEKGVKGIAKTLPAKQKTVETKPVSETIVENELNKSASISNSETQTAQAQTLPIISEEQVPTAVVDQELNSPRASENPSTEQ